MKAKGGPLRGGGVIAPVGEKLLFEHTIISATRGGGVIYPAPPPPDPPLDRLSIVLYRITGRSRPIR